MKMIALKIAYLGTAYHGFQRQNNATSVQSCIEQAIEKVTGNFSAVTSCSRTDTGVHAKEFYLTFATENGLPPERYARALCAYLPSDITVYSSFEAKEDFHPRYSAVSKEYSYTIWNAPTRNPFLQERALHYPKKLDESLLQKAAAHFIGTHDFRGFMSAGSSVQNTVRTITKCEIVREGDALILSIAADGFLYNMVRIIVGTLLYVAEGKIKEEDLPNILLSGKRKLAGPTAEAQGLCLEKVEYKEGAF